MKLSKRFRTRVAIARLQRQLRTSRFKAANDLTLYRSNLSKMIEMEEEETAGAIASSKRDPVERAELYAAFER